MGNNFNISGVWQSLNDLWIPIILVVAGVIAAIFLIRFLVKKKWIGAVITMVIVAILAGGVIVYRFPHNIIDIKAEDVSKIVISDVEVTDTELIQDILDEFGVSEYKRTLPSSIGGRHKYSVQVYDTDGELKIRLGIADEFMVDTGTFWEQRESGKLDLSLLQTITEGAK